MRQLDYVKELNYAYVVGLMHIDRIHRVIHNLTKIPEISNHALLNMVE